jgi:hypothetical protein
VRDRLPVSERFWRHVLKTESCWIWEGAKSWGYGIFRGTPRSARRWAYVETHGPIPKGMVLDHLCRNRACVRPDHLEVVTQRVNVERSPATTKTHCKWGHELGRRVPRLGRNGVPTYYRLCSTCLRLRRRRQVGQVKQDAILGKFVER